MNNLINDPEYNRASKRTAKLAIALFIYGLLAFIGGCVLTVSFAGPGHIKDPYLDRYARITALISPFVGAFIIYGAYCLREMRRRIIAELAIVMTLLPLFGTCFPFGVPIFICGAIVSDQIFASPKKKPEENS